MRDSVKKKVKVAAFCLILAVGLLSGCTNSALLPAPLQVDRVAEAQLTPQGTLTGSAVSPLQPDPETVDVEIYQGATVGFTPEGFPYRGDPNAPVILHEFSDYQCPYCARHFNATLPALMETYVISRQVLYVFHDFPIASLHPNAPLAHAAAQCVAEQGAARFWKMHDLLFQSQAQWRELPDPLQHLALLAEMSGAEVEAYTRCMAAGETKQLVEQGVADATALGFDGTPSFQFVDQNDNTYTLIGAQPLETFSRWIDALVAGEKPPQAQEAEQPELPHWATAEGLTPDPNRPGYTTAGDPYKGNPQAKVVVVEFSNFQCPHCQEYALNVQPAIDEALIDSEQLLWVFKNLPLRSLPQSLVAATAGECAGEQGEFWAMHNLLFEELAQWSVEEPDPVLVSLAEQVGMDTEQFAACLSSRQALERVVNDLFDAQGVVRNAPSFIILSGGRGWLIEGSRSAEEFIKTLNGYLERSDAQP